MNNHWVSVEERLPEKADLYIIYDGGIHIAHFTTDMSKCWCKNREYDHHAGWYINSDWGDLEFTNVTHWSPLPSPPDMDN